MTDTPPAVSPALMRVLDRLDDTPAQVVTDLGETLAQNRLATDLLGDQTRFTGAAGPARRMLAESVSHQRWPQKPKG